MIVYRLTITGKKEEKNEAVTLIRLEEVPTHSMEETMLSSRP